MPASWMAACGAAFRRNFQTGGVRDMRIKAILVFLSLQSVIAFAAPVIVIPDNPVKLAFPSGETQAYAASFLNEIITKATGEKLKIIPERSAGEYQERIFIGSTAAARRQIGELNRLKPEALVVRSIGRDLILCGEVSPDNVDRGTLFAVYEYLERALGVRWYYPDDRRIHPDGFGTIIPRCDALQLEHWDIYDWPRFRSREGGVSYYAWPEKYQRLWHPVLRFGSSVPRRRANHTQIGWYALYKNTHPEYFAVAKDGKTYFNTRHPHRNYICPNQPGVLEQMISNLKAFDQRQAPVNAWGPCPPSGNEVYFAFNDGMTPDNCCQCSACRRQYNPGAAFEKQASGWAFSFTARYAGAIRAIWPGRRLATLAYQHYQAPPEGIAIPDNLDVTYVTKIMHYASAPELFNRELEKMRAWSKLLDGKTERFGVWLNIVDPAMYTSKVPFMYPNIFKRWLLSIRQLTDSCFINGLNSRLSRLGEEGRLNAFSTYPMVWLQSKLLWNPEYSVDDLLSDYIRNSFGPAADTMHKFYDLVISRWEDIPWSPEITDEIDFIHRIRYNEERALELKQLLNQAADQCKPDSPEYQRIVFWRDRIYSRFFQESACFHRYAGKIPEYYCKSIAVEPEEADWLAQPKISLVERQWGNAPEKTAAVRMLRKGDELLLRLEMPESDPEDEFRIFTSDTPDAVQKGYAPNVNKQWTFWQEYRVRNERSGSTFSAIVRLPVSGRKELRLQIMRYGGIWNRFDLWSPTLRPVSDFPVNRFGRVIFDAGDK